MEALRQWGFSLCVAALACSLIRMLLPRTSLTRTLQVALSVFFLTVLIQPLWKAELAEEISIRSTSGMEEAERIAETLDAAHGFDFGGFRRSLIRIVLHQTSGNRPGRMENTPHHRVGLFCNSAGKTAAIDCKTGCPISGVFRIAPPPREEFFK